MSFLIIWLFLGGGGYVFEYFEGIGFTAEYLFDAPLLKPCIKNNINFHWQLTTVIDEHIQEITLLTVDSKDTYKENITDADPRKGISILWI